MTNHARFIGLLLETIPEVRAAVEEREGIYCRMSAFVDFVNEAIRAGDWATVRKSYAFVDRILGSKPDRDVLNAICVGFIEHLDFTGRHGNGPAAKKLLPPRLLTEWKSLEAHWKEYAEKAGKQEEKLFPPRLLAQWKRLEAYWKKRAPNVGKVAEGEPEKKRRSKNPRGMVSRRRAKRRR